MSNCVINLAPDKAAVFREAYRVLAPGGRLAVSDVVAIGDLPAAIAADPAAYTGCFAGAAPVAELERLMAAAGFSEVRITLRDEARTALDSFDDGDVPVVSSALIEAVKAKVAPACCESMRLETCREPAQNRRAAVPRRADRRADASEEAGPGATAVGQARQNLTSRANQSYRPSTMNDEGSGPPDLCCPPDVEFHSDSTAKLPPDEADGELAAFARALSHPVRVRILRLLATKDTRRCSHLVDDLPLAQSTVSEHLRILRSAGLVQVAERGGRVGYCLVPSALSRLSALVNGLRSSD